jgi:uncharacterized membrane protein
MESLEHGLYLLAGFLEIILEGISVLCILIGLLQSLQQISITRWHSKKIPSLVIFNDFRINFGAWLLLALEFQLAADIINTTVAPSFESLGKLGIIAIIRTFLNYFLNRELAETIKIKEDQLKLGSDQINRP